MFSFFQKKNADIIIVHPIKKQKYPADKIDDLKKVKKDFHKLFCLLLLSFKINVIKI